MAKGRFSVEAVFKAVDRLTRPVAKMQGRIGRFARKAERQMRDLNRVTGKIAGGIKKVGMAAVAAGAAAGVAFGNIIRAGADFEQTLVSAAARMRGDVRQGTEAFRQLEAAAKEVGATTEFSATQAAEGLKFLALAGLDASQSISALPKLVNFATAGELDLGRASDIATDALGSMGMASSDAAENAANLQRVMDVMTRATSDANMNVDQLFDTIAKAGPVAATAGVSIEELAGLSSVLAGAGIKGAEGGTALRNAILELAAPASAGAKALKRLGVEVATAEDGSLDMTRTLDRLAQATGDLGKQQKIQALSAIFGRRTIGPLITQMEAGKDVIGAFRESLDRATGTTDNMAATMRDTTRGDLNALSSAIEGVKLALFDVVKGPLRNIVTGMADWARANREVIASGLKGFLETIRDNFESIVAWARRIAVFVGTFLAVAAAIKVATGAMALFNAVMAMNPITLVAIAIIAAIGLILAFWPEISAFFVDLWEGIKDVAARIAEAVGGFIRAVWDPVKDFLIAAGEFVVGLVMLWIRPLLPILRPVFDAIAAAAGWIMSKWEPIKAFFAGVWQGITSAFTAAWNKIVEVAAVVFKKLKAVWEPIRDFFAGLWDGIVAHFERVFGGIINVVSGVVNFVRGVGRDALDGDEGRGAPAPQTVSPQERVARSVSETTNTTRGEVTIRDESGRAEVTRAPQGGIVGLQLESSGAF